MQEEITPGDAVAQKPDLPAQQYDETEISENEMKKLNQVVSLLKAISPALQNVKIISEDIGGIKLNLPGNRSLDYALYSDEDSRVNWEVLLTRAKDFLAYYQPTSPEIGEAEKKFAELTVKIASAAHGERKLLDKFKSVFVDTFAIKGVLKKGVNYNERAIGSHIVVMTQEEILKIYQ